MSKTKNNFVLFILFSILLTSCSQMNKKNVAADVVFCYMSDVFVDDNMETWGIYSDYTCYNGESFYQVKAKRHIPHGEIDYNRAYRGRIYSFSASSYIEGGSFGIGYLNKAGGTEVAISTRVISRQENSWLYLSINSNYTKIMETTSWTIPSIDTRTFVSMVFSEFDPDSSGEYGYNCYPVLKSCFIDNLDDYSDDLAKALKWKNNYGIEVSFYSELKKMEHNYSNKKNIFDWAVFGVGISQIVMLLFAFLIVIKGKIHGKK